ncbi:hypothetical protein [Citrobacter portucalensis]|nr:hypothetical protein [Citrobacter portucalensis]MCX8986048.1 hypothetical protein [Citrobacter portucalensis]
MQEQLSWRFVDQISSGNVGFSRTLRGSQPDLVERNNTIVMDYRKQQVV